jgi:ribonuclease HI
MEEHSQLLVHVDGGARGNPGPAAIGVVISTPRGDRLASYGEKIGETTNNVAEYRALLKGLELAAGHGARQVRVINDSELVAKQVSGVYKVKHPAMQELHRLAMAALSQFDSWNIESVPRAHNAAADALVNEALDR